MLKRFLKNQRGLTLVELLAVIVILGIIAAIAVPNIGGLINKTKDDAKVAEAVQIINAAKLAHATKSNKNAWAIDSDITLPANHTYKLGPDLDSYLEKVDDGDCYVIYDAANKRYEIVNYDGLPSTLSVNSGQTGITEQQLLDYTNN